MVDPEIKISDFETILTDKFHRRESKDNETFLEQLLWMDPEIVKASGNQFNISFFPFFNFFLDFGFIPDLGKTNFRTFEVPRGSTKQHDIYSFGIIVQEGINESYGGGFNCSKFDPWISDLGDLLSARTIFHGI